METEKMWKEAGYETMVVDGVPVIMEIGSYIDGGLYLALNELDGELYGDITINLPIPKDNPYDAFLSDDMKGIVEFLEDIGAGVPTGKEVSYNTGKYSLFHFYPGRLAELNKKGFEEFEKRRYGEINP